MAEIPLTLVDIFVSLALASSCSQFLGAHLPERKLAGSLGTKVSDEYLLIYLTASQL